MNKVAVPRIAAIGEVMVELAPYREAGEAAGELQRLAYAGDTFNTAVYLARLGVETEYVTLLGDDWHSDRILALMAEESVGSSAIVQVAGACPGLYMITNTPDGEREFTYWRKEAPARQLFGTAQAVAELQQTLAGCDAIYLSGITLAIISEEARTRLADFLREFRANGGKVAFDSNYRPRLWSSREEARSAIMALMAESDIALLTLDDEKLLWDTDAIEDCRERYRNTAAQELVLKRGASDVVICTAEGQQAVPVPPVAKVVDTTGAGDTFNAGYLAARLSGATPRAAAENGIRCAGITIGHPGGVINRQAFLNAYRA